MGFFGKLILATAVLLVQTSLGRVLCVCPPEAPTPVSAKVAACPMSMQPGCTCCEGDSAKKVEARKKPLDQKSGACQTKAEKKQDAQQAASTPELPVAAAIIPSGPNISLRSVAETPVQTHLVVPRIRPPDPGLPGLRAPPTR